MRKSVLLISTLLVVALFSINKANAQGMYVPSAYGAWGNTIFAGASSFTPDGTDGKIFNGGITAMAAVGFGLGNPMKNVGLETQMNIFDIRGGSRTSVSIKLHKNLGNGWASAVGMDNIFVSGSGAKGLGYGGKSMFLSFSRNMKYASVSEAMSKFSYSVGLGAGSRFSNPIGIDLARGKGYDFLGKTMNGTFVFGAVEYAVMKWLDVSAEWSARNLNVGAGLNFNVGKIPVRIVAGAADLTGFTGDGAKFVMAGSMAYRFTNVKYVEVDTKSLEEKLEKDHKELLEKTAELKKDHEELLKGQKALQDRLAALEVDVQKTQASVADRANGGYNNATSEAYAGTDIINDSKKGYSPAGKNLYDRGTGNFVVVYSRRTLSKAEDLAKSLKAKGVPSEITQNKIKSWYHVYTHLYSPEDLKGALQKSSEQRRNGYVGSWVLVK